MVVRDRLLLPFKLADNLNVPVKQARLGSKIGRSLSAALAAAAPPEDLFSLVIADFAADPVSMVNELMHLSPATKLIYVPYVAHADAGLVKAWGEGLMQSDGTIAWYPGQPEELTAAKSFEEAGLADTFLALAKVGGSGQAFDDGDLPPLDFPTHSRPVTAPSAEQEPGKPTVKQRRRVSTNNSDSSHRVLPLVGRQHPAQSPTDSIPAV